jgi:hypothetical protein
MLLAYTILVINCYCFEEYSENHAKTNYSTKNRVSIAASKHYSIPLHKKLSFQAGSSKNWHDSCYRVIKSTGKHSILLGAVNI